MLIWKAHARPIDALAFSPDGRTLALAGSYLACRLVDATTGQRSWAVESVSAFGLSLAFTPKGEVLCRKVGLSVRAADDGTERRNTGDWCQSFGLAPDGRTAYVADGTAEDSIRRYDLKTGRSRRAVELESGAINRIAVSADGTLVAAVGCKRFYLLRADTFEVVASVAERTLSNGAFALAFHPSGKSLVFTAGRTLFVWDVIAARETALVQLNAKYFMDAAFTPDGSRLLTVSKEGSVRVWDAATWQCERSFEWDVGPLRAVAVAPDGTRAAVAGDTGRVVVWDLDL